MDAHALAREALDWLAARPPWLSVGACGFVAGIEYVIPPVPHDVVVVAGGVLAARGVFHWATLLVVVTCGSVAGALAAWRIGKAADESERARRFVARFVSAESLAVMGERFRRYGPALIVANRFLPGLRTTLLFGAGMFRMPIGNVAVCSAVSAFVWNGLLIGAGAVLGKNIDEVIDLVAKYSAIAWCVVAVAVAALALRFFVHSRRARRARRERAAP